VSCDCLGLVRRWTGLCSQRNLQALLARRRTPWHVRFHVRFFLQETTQTKVRPYWFQWPPYAHMRNGKGGKAGFQYPAPFRLGTFHFRSALVACLGLCISYFCRILTLTCRKFRWGPGWGHRSHVRASGGVRAGGLRCGVCGACSAVRSVRDLYDRALYRPRHQLCPSPGQQVGLGAMARGGV
jgi:hypothetical protein